MSKNLITRIAVASVSIPVILWICYQGGWWLMGMVTIFASVALFEYFYQEGIKAYNPILWLAYLILISMFIHESEYFHFEYLFEISGGIIFLLLAGMTFSIGKKPPDELFTKYTRLFWGLIYIGGLYPFVYKIGGNYNLAISGGDWLLFLFAILWVGDTAAMFVGKAFGKHKLAPAVSPNKTFEGFIGGIIGAVVVGLIMYYWKFNSLDWYHILIIVIGCSIFGQLGDLVESMWKRSLDIKDSSALIPGHGGILDRFDSLLFAAPFMYFYINSIL